MKKFLLILCALFLTVPGKAGLQIEDLPDWWGYREEEIIMEYGKPSKVSLVNYGVYGMAKVLIYVKKGTTTEFRLLDGVIFRAQEISNRSEFHK